MTLLGRTGGETSSQEAEPSAFERHMSDRADEIVAAGKTGYAWKPVDELLQQELDDRIVAKLQTQGNSDFVLYSPRAASTG
jgi:hypothetical protein